MSKSGYKWATLGDLNAFFALFFDNVVNLFILAEILVSFGFPREFIYTKIIPGTALGVLIGDLIYTWLAFRLAKKTGREGITAMPLGIDMPSTVGIAIIVLGPSFLVLKESLGDVDKAALFSWYIGIGTMLWMGVIKTIFAFLGPYIQRVVPSAGMVGSIAGIGLVWLGAQGIIGVYELPFVGLLSLVIIVFTLIGHFEFPFKIPGAAAAVLVGTLVYYGMGLSGALEGMNLPFTIPGLDGLGLHLPLPQMEGLKSMFGQSLNFLPMALPLSILVISVSINIVEAARLMGDTYNPRTIILTDALATFAAGICGGVAQSTPYFGHSAYKRMGARASYTLAAGLAVGLGGMFGMIGFFVDLIPGPAIKPILIFIGFDMIRLTFNLTPPRHIMAAVFAIVPSVLNFTYVKLKSLYGHVQEAFSALQANVETATASGLAEKSAPLMPSGGIDSLLPAHWLNEFLILGILGQGFILTAMIWGSAVAFIIDRRIHQAAATMGLAAVLSFFGFIHSVFPSGNLYLPWKLALEPGNGLMERSLTIPYEFAGAYLLAALTLLLMYYLGSAKDGEGPTLHNEPAGEETAMVD